MKIKEIIQKKIHWKKHPNNKYFFHCVIAQENVLLRMNDFPDEPLLTVILDIEVEDLDDIPSNWSLED